MNKIVERLFLVYLVLKPYYLFESGGLQIGDIILLIGFILYLVFSKFNQEMKSKLFTAIQANKLFILFTFLTFAINAAYFAVYGMSKFLLSSLYYVFIFLAIALFYIYGQNKSFLTNVSKVLKFNLLAQLAISLVGIGRDYDSERYMGTFNDPNQFGFYILISYLFIYAINVVLKNKKQFDVTFFITALFLIFQSASTGSLFGLAIFAMLQIAYNIKDILHVTYPKIQRTMYSLGGVMSVAIIIFVFAGLGAFNLSKFDVNALTQDQAVTQRIQGKVAKADNEANISLWEDRGYDIIYKYPNYIAFGAGEGNYDRYIKATNNYGNEVHATFPSMLFYYGIIPFLIIAAWLYKFVEDVDAKMLIIYSAIVAESFILLNQRQSLFWMLFVLGYLYYNKNILAVRRSI